MNLNLGEGEFWNLTWPELTAMARAWNNQMGFLDSQFAYLRWTVYVSQAGRSGRVRGWQDFKMMESTEVKGSLPEEIAAQLSALFTEKI